MNTVFQIGIVYILKTASTLIFQIKTLSFSIIFELFNQRNPKNVKYICFLLNLNRIVIEKKVRVIFKDLKN